MTRFTSIVASALALTSMCSAHMILANPKPYGNPDNSPLTSSNYPCHISGDAATFYSTDGLSNTATAGETVSMSFTGSAVHGGGSCQVALTTDMQPSKSTRWSVILSIEGGCPSKDGTTPSTYDVKIPSDIPAGDYSYAWTWTSKLSGTQEYYMNCAPITIKAAGGSKRRSTNIRARSDALDSYPPLAVYNLADINSCKSVLSSDPKYAFPGSNVEHLLSTGTPTYEDITGDNCFASGVTYDGSSSGSSSGGDSSSGSDSSSSSATTSAAVAATPAAAATTAAAAPDSPSGFLTSVVATSTSAAAVATTQAATSAAAAPTGSTSGSSSSSSSSSSGSCTMGEYKCASDGTSFQMCVAGGEWSTTMSVAAGTQCTPGTSASLSIAAIKKREGLPLLV